MPGNPHVYHHRCREHTRSLAHAILEDDKEKVKKLLIELDREEAREKYWTRIVFIVIALVTALLVILPIILLFGQPYVPFHH